MRTQAEADRLEQEKKKREAELLKKSRDAVGGGGVERNTSRSRQAADESLLHSEGKLPALSKTRGKAGAGVVPPLDVSGMESVELLSANEIRLCGELRLIPRHWYGVCVVVILRVCVCFLSLCLVDQ